VSGPKICKCIIDVCHHTHTDIGNCWIKVVFVFGALGKRFYGEVCVIIGGMKQLLPLSICLTLLIGAACSLADVASSPATQPTTRTTASGLTIVEVKTGDGDVAGPGDTVSVHYTGKLKDGTKFDSSYDRNQPIQFVLGAHQVIPGWDEGIAGMKVGEKRQLIIPPDLAYGANGTPDGTIPPNSTLYFDVELMGVTHP
jgi:hypothetical protein